jgi:hypothetical protein
VIGTATVPVVIDVVPSPTSDTTTPPTNGAACTDGTSIATTVATNVMPSRSRRELFMMLESIRGFSMGR